MRERGLLIAIEGADGAGLTTQARRLCHWLEHSGVAAVRLKPRGSLALRPHIRRFERRTGGDEESVWLLYAADLADQLEQAARPALEAGSCVVFDGYVLSLLARARLRGAGADWLAAVLSFAQPADLSFALDAPAEERLRRILRRRRSIGRRRRWPHAPDSDLAAALEYQGRLADAIADLAGIHRVPILDANARAAQVHRELRAHVAAHLAAVRARG